MTPSPTTAGGDDILLLAGRVGVVVILLGVLLAAYSGVGVLRQLVLHAPEASFAQGEAAPFAYRCPETQLRLENLSVAACHGMAAGVGAYMRARPDWFRGAQTTLAALSVLLGCVSVYAGLALVDYRAWGATAALGVVGALLLVDLAQLAALAAVGAWLREAHLPQALLWGVAHALLGVALWVLRAAAREGDYAA